MFRSGMGELRRLNGGRSYQLQPEHLIGRGPQCALRLEHEYVSAQHAVIRWSGTDWQLLDRGSRNGTTLDGRRLDSGRAYPLREGAVIAFGHSAERWQLHDAREPGVMVTSVGTGESIPANGGIISIPAMAGARCTLFLDGDGNWRLERGERAARVLLDGDEFEVAGTIYRFCCPVSLGSTVSPDAAQLLTRLCFRVSADLEFVELALVYPSRTVSLGSRSHNFLLLILAESRLKDVAAGIDAENCGWMYKADLADALKTTPQQIDGEVHRIRSHLVQHQVVEADRIIERRPRTTQLRIGLPQIEISRARAEGLGSAKR